MHIKSLLACLLLLSNLGCKPRSFNSDGGTKSVVFTDDEILSYSEDQKWLLWKSAANGSVNVNFGRCEGDKVESRFCKNNFDTMLFSEFVNIVNTDHGSGSTMSVSEERAQIEKKIRDLKETLNAPNSVVSHEAKLEVYKDLATYRKSLAELGQRNARVNLIALLNLPSPVPADKVKLIDKMTTNEVFAYVRTIFAFHGKEGSKSFVPFGANHNETKNGAVRALKIKVGHYKHKQMSTSNTASHSEFCFGLLENQASKTGSVVNVGMTYFENDSTYSLSFRRKDGSIICSFTSASNSVQGIAAELNKIGLQISHISLKPYVATPVEFSL